RPLLGPGVGGWLTENVSSEWSCFINLPGAATLITLLLIGLPHQKPDWHEAINADWLGIFGMSLGLSSLTVVLEEGQRDQWFQSELIIWLTVTAVIGLTLMAIAQFTAPRPVIKLRLMRNRSYASVILIIMSV